MNRARGRDGAGVCASVTRGSVGTAAGVMAMRPPRKARCATRSGRVTRHDVEFTSIDRSARNASTCALADASTSASLARIAASSSRTAASFCTAASARACCAATVNRASASAARVCCALLTSSACTGQSLSISPCAVWAHCSVDFKSAESLVLSVDCSSKSRAAIQRSPSAANRSRTALTARPSVSPQSAATGPETASPQASTPSPCPWRNSKLGYCRATSAHSRHTPKSCTRTLVS